MQKESESRSKRLSHPNELSENCRKGCHMLGWKSEEQQLVELIGDQSPSPEAPSRSKWREQRKYPERSDCQRSYGKCWGH